jgi:putative peptidoglycan lipid II flippase
MRLYRAFFTVGGMTGISRVLGFVRDILIAAVIGTGVVADAFFVAFRFPNLFRRLFGEGAFNAAFVPLFAKRLEGDGKVAARGFAEEALAGLLFVLLVLLAVAELAMPWFITLLAPGFSGSPGKFDLTVLLSRIAFPYLLCMSLVALLSGVLNSMHRFTAAAAAPILLNVVLIGAMGVAYLLGYRNEPMAGVVLAWGVAAAGLAQLMLLWIAVRRTGFALTVRRPTFSNDMRRLVALGVPGLIAGGVTQINLVAGTLIASLQESAVSFLYYADRLYQLPLGIVGVAIGVVLLPDLARKLRAGDEAAVLVSQNRALEFALLLTLPAAVGLAVLSEPIISVLFERGSFTRADTVATAAALAAFASGLPFFVAQKVLQPGFFAREDTTTPMRFAWINLGVNLVLSVVLFFAFSHVGWMGHVGIAIATSIAGAVNAILLWATLAGRGHFRIDDMARRNLWIIVLGTAVMAIVFWFVGHVLLQPYLEARQSNAVRMAALGGVVAIGLAMLGVVAGLTGIGRKLLVRRSGGGPSQA